MFRDTYVASEYDPLKVQMMSKKVHVGTISDPIDCCRETNNVAGLSLNDKPAPSKPKTKPLAIDPKMLTRLYGPEDLAMTRTGELGGLRPTPTSPNN